MDKIASRTDEVAALHYVGTAFREYWKQALICFTALFAIGGAGVIWTAKTTYSSRAVLPLSPSIEALVKTEAVLDPVLQKSFSHTQIPVELARERLADVVTVSPELATGSSIRAVSVSDETPEQARAVLQQLLESLFAASIPRGPAQQFLVERIKNQTAALTRLKALEQSLQESARTVKGGNEGEQYSRAMVGIVSDIASKENELWQLQNSLLGMQPSEVIVPPTISTVPNPKRLLAKLTSVATVAAALTLAFVILLKQWRHRYPPRASQPVYINVAAANGTLGKSSA
jgi:hypothetical protein